MEQQHIIITGANGNLGRTVTEEFSKSGFYLNLVERNQSGNSPSQSIFRVDFSDENAVSQMVSQIISSQGKIDAAINLAGSYAPGDIEQLSLDEIEKMFKANFYTAVNMVTALLPYYKTAGKGKFIFMGAKAAMNIKTAKHNVAYALSKQLLYSLCDLINESEENISAHIILPGTIDTEANRKAMPNADFSKWVSPSIIAKTMVDITEGREERKVITF